MMRFIIPTVILGITISLFVLYTDPIYKEMTSLQTQIASYNDANNNYTELEKQRDSLTTIENSIDPLNLTKLQKLLPDNVDNIRLILEIQKIAAAFGMTLTDIKYSSTLNTNTTSATNTGGAVVQGGGSSAASKDYGVFNLDFSVSGTYNNFISFVKSLESNLRIVDISSISFSSNTTQTVTNSKITTPDVYKYGFTIKTYWLKN